MTAIFERDGIKTVVEFHSDTRTWLAIAFGPNEKVIAHATGITKNDAIRIVESKIRDSK